MVTETAKGKKITDVLGSNVYQRVEQARIYQFNEQKWHKMQESKCTKSCRREQ